jgi:Membrane bound beta barrel domain (DUF5777)
MYRFFFSTFLFCYFINFSLLAQSVSAYHTFRDTRLVNTTSAEVLAKHKLNVRFENRFGDLAGTDGGWKTFYGLDTPSDASFGAEYGLFTPLTLGISRTRGAGLVKQNINGLLKYRLLQQQSLGGSPITLTLLNVTSLSTMPRDTIHFTYQSFTKLAHRVVYTTQAIVARKFNNRFSLQVSAGYNYRNIVAKADEHGIVVVGAGTRFLLTHTLSLLADATIPLTGRRALSKGASGYFPALGFGLEMNTGGHVFQLNVTNAKGICENDYVPYTQSNWSKGQFRIGLTISRLFNL